MVGGDGREVWLLVRTKVSLLAGEGEGQRGVSRVLYLEHALIHRQGNGQLVAKPRSSQWQRHARHARIVLAVHADLLLLQMLDGCHAIDVSQGKLTVPLKPWAGPFSLVLSL